MSSRSSLEGAEWIERSDASLLELVDQTLNKGVVIHGELMLGLADVDLVYVRLSALLCAADRLWPSSEKNEPKKNAPKDGS